MPTQFTVSRNYLSELKEKENLSMIQTEESMSTKSTQQETLEAIFGTEERNNQNQRVLKENK